MRKFDTNEQRLLPLANKQAGQLWIHEIYRSIQGESTYGGFPCVFVRLAVCDARCTWCDTPHAFTQGQAWTMDRVIEKVQQYDCPLVEITGGEPLLQEEVFSLMSRLADLGKQVLLETSGAHPIQRVDPRVHIIMDIKCPESGESENNYWENLEHLKPTDEIKFVIASQDDFDWAAAVVRENELEGRQPLLFSPVFDRVTARQLAEWILDSGLQVRMQLQMHKYIWHPKARGV